MIFLRGSERGFPTLFGMFYPNRSALSTCLDRQFLLILIRTFSPASRRSAAFVFR